MSNENVPNPFASAKRVVALNVTLKAADLIDAWPDTSVETAKRIFDQNGAKIAERMIAAGVEAAIDIIINEGIGDVRQPD